MNVNIEKQVIPAILALLSVLILFGVIPARGQTTWNVPGVGSNTCTPTNPSCNTIQAAVNAASDGDTINIAAGTYQENVNIFEETLTLQGAGVDNTIVDGVQNGDPVFEISCATVTLEDMTITNGMSTIGGGISSFSSTVAVNNCTISNNMVVGSGIFTGDGGGIFIDSESAMDVSNSTISSNMGDVGGGINNDGGRLTITDTTISSNGALGKGGGILNVGTMTITCSTISGNSASSGGGILNEGTMTITNSTISENSSFEGGGGIFNDDSSTVNILNCTLSGNTTLTGSGGSIFNNGGTVQLSSSIVANTPSGGDCSGGITSLGFNLASDGSCNLNATGDLANTNPELAPLQLNAPGTTETQALCSGSPAIDAGDPMCPPPSTDQRGVTRPQGTRCDIGAYEGSASCPLPLAKSGGGCSIASTVSSSSILLYLLLPVFIVIKRMWRRFVR